MNYLQIKRAAASFDPKQLAMGKRVELEHRGVTGGNPKITEQIAKDHLKEDAKYYTHLKAMEDQYSTKKANGDESGVPVTEEVVREWLLRNPNPEDSAVHGFAQAHGYNKHALEEVIYRLATQQAKQAAYQEGIRQALRDTGIMCP